MKSLDDEKTRTLKAFGRNVMRKRMVCGMTQAELSRTSGVPGVLVHDIEAGAYDAELSIVEDLAKALKILPAELFRGV